MANYSYNIALKFYSWGHNLRNCIRGSQHWGGWEPLLWVFTLPNRSCLIHYRSLTSARTFLSQIGPCSLEVFHPLTSAVISYDSHYPTVFIVKDHPAGPFAHSDGLYEPFHGMPALTSIVEQLSLTIPRVCFLSHRKTVKSNLSEGNGKMAYVKH